MSIIILSLLLVQCGKNNSNKTIFINQPEIVRLEITPNTTIEELDSIALILKKDRDIEIDYSKTSFDKSGYVISLDLDVVCKDGYAGSVRANSSMLDQDNHGFERNYNKTTKSSFYVGTIK